MKPALVVVLALASCSELPAPRDASSRCGRADARALVADGRLERAVRVLAAAEHTCPAEASALRVERAEILASLGRWDELARTIDAIVADRTSTVDDRRTAAGLRDRLDIARRDPPPLEAARRDASGLRERADALVARDPSAARDLYLRAWQLVHPSSLALAGAARASELAGDLAASRRLYERAAAEAEREANAPIELSLALGELSEPVERGELQAARLTEKLPWPAKAPTVRDSIVLVDRRTHAVERVLASRLGEQFQTDLLQTHIVFDRDGHTLIVGTEHEVEYVDIETARVVKSIRLLNGTSWGLAPSGKLLARWDETGLQLVDTATGAVRRRLAAEPSSWFLLFSPDSRRLATFGQWCSDPATEGDWCGPVLRMFDVATGKDLGSLPLDTDVKGAAFSADGQRIVLTMDAYDDRQVVVADTSTVRQLAACSRAELATRAAALGVTDVPTPPSITAAWPQHARIPIEAVGLPAGGDVIALRLQDRLVGWATTGNRAAYPAVALEPGVNTNGTFAAGGERYATPVGKTAMLALYDARTGRRTDAVEGPCQDVRAIALDPAGTRIAAGCEWGVSRSGPVGGPLLPFVDRQPLETIAIAGGAQAWTVRDQNGTLLAGSGKPIDLGVHAGPALALSRDGRWLAVGIGQLDIWDVAHETKVRSFDHGSRYSVLQFTPDAKTVLEIGSSATAYDVATGKKRYDFVPYTSSIFAYAPRTPGLAFGPGGTVFASPIDTGEVALVRTADGRELGRIYAWTNGTGAVVARDGRFALLGGATELPDATCRAGAFALPFATCRDRLETPDLLVRLLAGDR